MLQTDENNRHGEGLVPLFGAVRTQLGVVVSLWLLAAVGWYWSATSMAGMDNGPWTMLGSGGWFVLTWTVMMAAMMLPSVAPTVALYQQMTRARSARLALLFAGGYLLTWAAVGVLVYVLASGITAVAGDALAWQRLGRMLAGLTLLLAAVYQLTPIKNVCLEKCRSPLGQLLGSWRVGWQGALRMGIANGAWCVGCCWALMLALFALGIMSLSWMAVVTGIIALEKLLPWRRLAVYGTAGLLALLGIIMLLVPGVMPGLTIPAVGMDDMPMMG